MAFEVHSATKELWDDLVALFDRPVVRTCFCMFYRKTGSGPGVGADNRRAMRALVNGGTVPGLIGYEDEVPVAARGRQRGLDDPAERPRGPPRRESARALRAHAAGVGAQPRDELGRGGRRGGFGPRPRVRLYMAASALNFEAGRTQVHQVLAVQLDEGRSGCCVPGSRRSRLQIRCPNPSTNGDRHRRLLAHEPNTPILTAPRSGLESP